MGTFFIPLSNLCHELRLMFQSSMVPFFSSFVSFVSSILSSSPSPFLLVTNRSRNTANGGPGQHTLTCFAQEWIFN